MVIEKKIHFVWIGSEKYPEKYNKFVNSFKDKNPDFDIKIWYEADIMKLFDHPDLSKYKDKWMNLELVIMKCDLSRSLILHAEGGIYVDLDFVCYKNLSGLLEGRDLLLAREALKNGKRICNCTYGGKKGHKFFTHWLDYSFEAVKKKGKRRFGEDIFSHVTRTTGPDIFYTFVTENGYEYMKDPCLVAPVCEMNTICQECVKGGVTKVADGYHEVIGNYMDTKWYEGTGYAIDRSPMDIISFVASKVNVNPIVFLIMIIVLVLFLCYCLYRYINSDRIRSPVIRAIE